MTPRLFEPNAGFIVRYIAKSGEGSAPVITRALPVSLYEGPLRISWALGADPQHEDLFWDKVHANGAESGKYLAEYLDVRPNPTDQPQPWNIPATINPLQFLLRNLLRGNVLLVRAKSQGSGPNRMNASYLANIRKILPPHVLFLFLVEMPAISEVGPTGYEAALTDISFSWTTAVGEEVVPATEDKITIKALPEFNP